MTEKTKFLPGLIICLSLFAGCSVSRTANTDKILVTQDAAIFDKRFKSVSLKDVNLESFWPPRAGNSFDPLQGWRKLRDHKHPCPKKTEKEIETEPAP